uniref:Reverse transcriptase domain-containing protein n=1 Tax=Tanacetum cinerariifolium TaxID=118510 RepID=A0A6L2NZQ5_TANCI|nr:hypothetical protein [Tanacetum cinerariifolium]
MRTRRSKARMVTPFANPYRQFRGRREASPVPNHSIYSFYESESSDSDSENIDMKTLTLEQYLAIDLSNTRKRSTCPDNFTFKLKLLRVLRKISFSEGPTDSVDEHIRESISVMPYSLFKRLGLRSLKPIRMTIKMADRSMQSPKEIKENILVKISKFVFPVDFIILGIMEDENISIILGRPLLATAHTKIDVYSKKISLGVGQDQVVFKINKKESPTSISPIYVINEFDKTQELDHLVMNDEKKWDFESYLSPEYESQDIISLSPSKSAEINEDSSMTVSAGSENRPPMLNKENYVSWSSHLLWYTKSRPNEKLIHNSIINGPYVRRMIPEPGDPNREVPVNETFHVQTDDELTDKELKQIEADDQAIQTILLGLPEDIYAAVDSCETAQEIWLRIAQPECWESVAQNAIQNSRIQNVENQNGQIVVPGTNQNLNKNCNLVAGRAEGNATGHNGIQLQAKEFDLMAAAADLDEIEEVNKNCILMANLQQASTSSTQTDKAPVYDSDGSAELLVEKSTVSSLLEEKKKLKSDFKIREDELLDKQIQLEKKIKELDNILVKTALGYQNPFYLKQAQQKQQSLYDGKVLFEKHDPPVVHDSEETLQLAQESRLKMKQLNKEIKPANYTKINYLSGVFVSQMAKSREELYFSNTSKTANVSKPISIPDEEFLDDTTPSVARKFLNEEAAKLVGDFKSLAKEADESLAKHKALELEIKRLLRAVVSQDIMSVVQNNSVDETSNLQTQLEPYNDMHQKIERLQDQLGDLKGKSKDTSCVSDTLNPLTQKLENENVELEFQVLNYAKENAHLKTTYKNLFDSISVTRTQTKTKINSLQNKLHDTIYENVKLRAQLFDKVSDQKDIACGTSANTKFAKQSILGKPPNVGMFRINPFKPSREEKHVPNKVRGSVRTNPITVSQPPVINKKVVNSDSNGSSSTGVENTKTRRPLPRSNKKNDRVPSASKSSCSKNKKVDVEEHHRKLLLSRNKKHLSSKCYNVKLATQNIKSKVICAMCKQFLISVNHDVCLLNYVNGMTSRATPISVLAAQVHQVRQTPSTSTSIEDTAPTSSNSSSLATNLPKPSQDVDRLKTQQQHAQQQGNQASLQPKTVADNVPNAMFAENSFVNPFANPSTNAAESSSSQYVDPSNMHMFYQPYPHEFQ